MKQHNVFPECNVDTLKYLMAKQYDANPSVAMQFFNGELTTANLAEMLS